MLRDLQYYKNLVNNDLESKPASNEEAEKDVPVKGFTGRSILSANIAPSGRKNQQGPASAEDSPFVATAECPIDECIPAPVVVTASSISTTASLSDTLNEIQATTGFAGALELQHALPQNDVGTLMFIKFDTVSAAQLAAAKVITLSNAKVRFKPVYYSTQHGDGPYVKTSSLLLDVASCDMKKVEQVEGILSYDVNQALLCIGKDNVWNVRSVCKPAAPKETYLVWPPWNKYSIGGLSSADVGSHRFADNQELRYSLRSLTMYAPWVRNIYIVTNGEIPHWLNVNHPRIKVIPHEEIFSNKSHLPTFSSPAIETHIHNIPGLSENFLYFNDDILLGRPVLPEDFVSSNGYKIYLAWNIPNCNTGCPPNWLSDGYCDLACNVSACSFDGGDCSKPSNQLANNLLNLQQRTGNFMNSYCNTGCTGTWICDKYCDPACNVEKCGFDAGDCGVADVKIKLFDVEITPEQNNTEVSIAKGVVAFYLNISGINEVTSVSYDIKNDDVIRTAAVSKPHKILSFTLFPNKTDVVNLVFECVEDMKLNIKLVLDTNIADPAYVKPVPIIEIKEVVEEWVIPEEKRAREVKMYEEVIKGGIAVVDKAEERRLEKMVGLGLLTEKGKWFRLQNFVEKEIIHEDTKPQEQVQEKTIIKSIEESKDINLLPNVDKLPGRELRGDTMSERSKVLEEKMPQRKLHDAFASSLHHVNNLYTQNFGKEQRRVLAHMPFMVNRTIVSKLHQR